MSTILEQAKKYLSWELSVIPTGADKRPLGSWKKYQVERMAREETDKNFKTAPGIAILGGKVSGGLEIIDVDSKNDHTGTLYPEFMALIEDALPDLFPLLVIASTKNKGYHIYYRAPMVEGNKKLANRPPTPEEKEIEPKVKEIGLIETRGEGGYVIAPPTPGYNIIQGSLETIPRITEPQRETLLGVARAFDSMPLKEIQVNRVNRVNTERPPGEITPLEDYNSRGDVLGLLLSNGWSVGRELSDRILLKRPGTKNKWSACLRREDNLFFVWTSSTEFENEKAYNPSQVYNSLVTGGDWKETTKQLRAQGYGTPPKINHPTSIKTEKVKVEALAEAPARETISREGEILTLEKITAQGLKCLYVIHPSGLFIDETLRAVEISERNREARIYTQGEREDGTRETPIRSFIYKLKHHLNRAGEAEEKSGGLNPEDWDRLRDEITLIGQNIEDPIDRDTYIAEVVKKLGHIGITRESLEATVEKLRYKRDREKQERELKKLLAEATTLQSSGKTTEAIIKLRDQARVISSLDKKQQYEDLLKPLLEEEIIKTYQGAPDSLETGYTLHRDGEGDIELSLPSGALTIIAGRTSHRKTGLMLNMALNLSERYKDREIHFFSYEESREAILMKLLNIYLNIDPLRRATPNLRYISGYFKTGGGGYTNQDFINGKERFFKEMIYTGRLRVHYSPFDIEELTGALEYLNTQGKTGAVFIDYIQLLRIGGNFQSRQLQLQEICEKLREAGIKARIPVILGAQFNRTVTMEALIDPGNIREAGDIEQTANTVIGLWDRAFTKESGTDKDRRGQEATPQPGTLYMEILKGRDIGAGARAELSYNGNTGKIVSVKTEFKPF